MRKLLGFSKNDVEACFDSFGWLSDRCAVLWRKIKCDFFPFAGAFLFREGRSLLDGACFFARENFFHEGFRLEEALFFLNFPFWK